MRDRTRVLVGTARKRVNSTVVLNPQFERRGSPGHAGTGPCESPNHHEIILNDAISLIQSCDAAFSPESEMLSMPY